MLYGGKRFITIIIVNRQKKSIYTNTQKIDNKKTYYKKYIEIIREEGR